MVLDKTGTVTEGKPFLKDVVSLMSQEEPDRFLKLAASLENVSEHPLARAVVEAAENKNLDFYPVKDFLAVPGNGIRGNVEGKNYYAGTVNFISQKGIDTSGVEEKKRNLEDQGNTVIVLSDEKKALALLALADKIKKESPEGIRMLKEMGLSVYIITGDNQRTAQVIARQVEVDNVLTQVLPEEKAEEIGKLKESGHIVAMAGDGINDAPALALADTGIAMASGSDIAIESADITLMRGDLRDIAGAVSLSKKTMNKIKQNLFWAFFYNSIGIPFAAMVVSESGYRRSCHGFQFRIGCFQLPESEEVQD